MKSSFVTLLLVAAVTARRKISETQCEASNEDLMAMAFSLRTSRGNTNLIKGNVSNLEPVSDYEAHFVRNCENPRRSRSRFSSFEISTDAEGDSLVAKKTKVNTGRAKALALFQSGVQDNVLCCSFDDVRREDDDQNVQGLRVGSDDEEVSSSDESEATSEDLSSDESESDISVES